jgi:ligand-binding sensor domain-containing protein
MIQLGANNSDLPSDWITCITIDHSGNKWIGTTDSGLVQYKNNSWIVYNTSNSGIQINSISTLMVTSDNQIWIGTPGGLVQFDGNNWIVYDESNSPLGVSPVSALASDNDGNIWVGSYGLGVLKFNWNNWTLYTDSNSDLHDNTVRSLFADRDNNIWIGTSYYSGEKGGLAKFDGTRWTIYDQFTADQYSNDINCILGDEMNTLWLGTDKPLIHFIEPKYKLFYLTEPENLWSINCLVQDQNEMIWISSSSYKVLAKYDGSDFIRYDLTEFGAKFERITSMAVDHFNNKWIATNTNGVIIFNDDGIINY